MYDVRGVKRSLPTESTYYAQLCMAESDEQINKIHYSFILNLQAQYRAKNEYDIFYCVQ